jgi:hypothetical protein
MLYAPAGEGTTLSTSRRSVRTADGQMAVGCQKSQFSR